MSKDFDPYYQWLGIPPSEQPADYYRLLGLQRFESDDDVISNAADRQMVFVRTFQQGKHSSESQKILNEISTAKICLLNTTKRADYDARLNQQAAAKASSIAAAPAATAAPVAPFSPSASSVFGAPPPGMAPAPPFEQYPAGAPVARPVAMAVATARPIAAPTQLAGRSADLAEPASSIVFEGRDRDGRRPSGSLAATIGGGAVALLALVAAIYFSGVLSSKPTVVVENPVKPAPTSLHATTTETSGESNPVATSEIGHPAVESTSEPAPAVAETTTPPKFDPHNPNTRPRLPGLPPDETLTLAQLMASGEFDSPNQHDYPATTGYRGAWPPARKSTELTADLDPAKYSIANGWRREGSALVSSDASPAILELPFPVAAGHRTLDVVVERLSGDGPFAIGAPMLGVDAVLLFGESENSRCGLAMVDGKSLKDANVSLRDKDDTFPIGEPRKIHVNWCNSFVESNVQPVDRFGSFGSADWKDDLRRIGASPDWPSPHPGRIFLGSEGSRFKITSIKFTERLQGVGSLPGGNPQNPQDLTLSSAPQDVIAGSWKKENGALLLLESDGRSRIELPYSMSLDYDLKIRFQRLASANPVSSQIAVGIPLNARQIMLSIDGPQGTGFELVNGAFLPGPTGRSTIDDSPHTLVVAWRRNEPNGTQFKLVAELDGRRAAEWEGDERIAETPANWIGHDFYRFWVGADCPVKFTEILLTPQANHGVMASTANVTKRLPFNETPAPAVAGMNPPNISANPPTRGKFGAPSMGAFEQVKRPAPTGEALTAARKQVEELYAGDIAGAKSTADKAALAQTLLTASREVGNDPPAQYALLDAARRFAAEGGDAAALTTALERLNDSFEIDRFPLLVASFQTAAVAAKSQKDLGAVAKAVQPLIDEAVAADRLEQAVQLAAIGYDAAGKARDNELRKAIRETQDQITASAEAAKAVGEAKKTLDAKPDDPDANQIVGKHLCFVKSDWAAGVPHLLKAKDEALRKIAALEQADPANDGEAAAALADAWWDAAKTASKADKTQYQIRARTWYQTSQSRLAGLAAKRVEKRLEEIAALNLDAGPGGKRAKTPGLPANAEIGMIGRISARGRDAGVLVKYHPGKTITSPNFGVMLNQPAMVDNRNAMIVLDAFLRVPTAGKVSIRHHCNSVALVNTLLFIDGQLVNTMGDDSNKDETITRDMAAGDHMVRWEIKGILRNVGESGVSFADADGKPLPAFFTVDALNALRNTPTIFELELGR